MHLGSQTRFFNGSDGMIKINIETNADEVVVKLQETPGIVTEATQLGLYDVADSIFAKSQWKVNVKTGHLKRSGNVRYGDMFAIVGYNAPYAGYVERGTRPHIIAPKTKGFLAWPTEAWVFGYKSGPGGVKIKPTGWVFTTKPVHHPGTKAYRYLGESVDETIPEIDGIMNARIQEALDRRKT